MFDILSASVFYAGKIMVPMELHRWEINSYWHTLIGAFVELYCWRTNGKNQAKPEVAQKHKEWFVIVRALNKNSINRPGNNNNNNNNNNTMMKMKKSGGEGGRLLELWKDMSLKRI